MFSLPKPEVILTHESDLDGFVSGLLLKRLAGTLFELDIPLEAYQNHNWRKRRMPEQAAWVCDLNFEPRLDKRNWLIVDHHPTDHPAQNALLVHDVNKSASLLCYEIYRQFEAHSPKLERVVQLSNIADLFFEDDPDFLLASDYANLVKTYQFWNLYELIEGDLEKLVDHPLLEVMATKRRVEDPIGLEWSKSNITEITPMVGHVNTVIGNTNSIVHQLLEKQVTPYSVLITLFRKGNGTVLVSLRSRQGEAIKIAEKLQGGGHPNACGAVLPRSIQTVSDAIAYLKQVLNARAQSTPLNNLEHLFSAIEVPEK